MALQNPLKLAKERARQDAAQDYNFFQKITYFFELRVPPSLSYLNTSSFLFPLLLPQGFEMEDPFTVNKTPTLGGGLSVEENGIVQRPIRIRGTTGFKPRRVRGNYKGMLTLTSPEDRSYGRMLPTDSVDTISGQRYFQYLQDAVFRTYADLKRDPATSEGVLLIFHNPKDQEHWLVVPENFKLTRDKGRPLEYDYDITLTAVGKAEAVAGDFSEDRGLLLQFKDELRTVRAGLDKVSGALNDITALTGELKRLIKNLATIIDGATAIATATSNFAAGVTGVIEAPYALINSTVELIEGALQAAEDLRLLEGPKLGDNILNKFRQMVEGMEHIGTHPEVFEQQATARMEAARKRQDLLRSATAETIGAAEAAPPPATLDESEQQGTGITGGDVLSARGDLNDSLPTRKYTGATERPIEDGDTLVNLAARFLGDARRWQYLATLNGLKPPFVDSLANAPLVPVDDPAMPGALGIGQTILIPNYSKPPSEQAQLPVLGVQPGEKADVHMLGRDVQLVQVGGREGAPIYDWAIDTEGGSTDAKTISGMANLGQALEFRLRVEKGSDTLYSQLGLERVIGLNSTAADLEMTRFRITQTVLQDPRIAHVRNVSLVDAGDSAIEADITAEVRGYTEGVTVRPVL